MKVRRFRKVHPRVATVACTFTFQVGVLLLGELGCSKNDTDGLAPSTARSPLEPDEARNEEDASENVPATRPRPGAAARAANADHAPPLEDSSPKQTSIPESNKTNQLQGRQIEALPGAGAGPCGCSADETCVTERFRVDEVREETRYRCVPTPPTCSTNLRCECAVFCPAGMVCRLGRQAGVIQCSTKMGP